MHHLNPQKTTWHITWGTYGARLPGGERPTVDKLHNQRGEAFIKPDFDRAWIANDSLRGEIVHLTAEQQLFVQQITPQLCERGRWVYRTCAAADDHVHVLIDIDPSIHGEKSRRLLKRWIGEALSERWGKSESGTWWAKEGSNIAIHDVAYLNNAFPYIANQRAE